MPSPTPKTRRRSATPPDNTNPMIDRTRPHPARVYNYLLGGKDHFAADRDVADEMITHIPAAPAMARANRTFLQHAVHHLVTDLGITQLLDIGAGLPTTGNVHEIAHAANPTARVVYVDNDALVTAHIRALSTPAITEQVAVIQADAAAPSTVLSDPTLTRTLDLDQPVALLLTSILMLFDDHTAHNIITGLADPLIPGSHIVISHPTADFNPDAVQHAADAAKSRRPHLPPPQPRGDRELGQRPGTARTGDRAHGSLEPRPRTLLGEPAHQPHLAGPRPPQRLLLGRHRTPPMKHAVYTCGAAPDPPAHRHVDHRLHAQLSLLSCGLWAVLAWWWQPLLVRNRNRAADHDYLQQLAVYESIRRDRQRVADRRRAALTATAIAAWEQARSRTA